MAKDLLDFSKFKKIFEDDKNTHLKHPKGHTIIVAHVALNPKLKKQIADLPMHPEKMVEMAKDIMEQLPHQKMAEGGKAEKPAVSRIDMNYKDVTKRIPQLTEAANKLSAGKLSAEEYDALVNKHKPVQAYGFVPQPASREEAMKALGSKGEHYGKTDVMSPGERADLRLDIPSYMRHGVWVNSIHRDKDLEPKTVYNSVSSVNNAQMIGSPNQAIKVASGQVNKSPFAVIRGEWNPMEEQEAVEQAQKFLNHKDWKQVGYDPERHGYFYDRESMQPIEGAEQVIQIGPLVLAKKPRYAKKEEQLFADGGEVDKPFKGYNSEKHSRTGGLNDSYREKYNREHGSNLKRPVTGTPEAGSKDAARKKSFCARMKGVKGPTSEGGELTPKGAALKRWNCHAHGGMIEDDDHDEECMHYAKGGRTSALLDEKGRKINKRSERERIFGSDANAPRMSDERMRMMQALRDKVKQEYGVGLRTAAGKRTESGEIRDEGVQPAFDVYTPEGREAERRYIAEQKALNPKFKRIDPKPDWNNPDKYMDTQPSPDAGIHEIAHARQIPLGMTLAEHQDAMDALQGQVQKDYGFLQNKRTSHEIQPMAMENSIRRELGFPANSSIATGTAHGYVENPETLAEHNAGRVSRGQPALETNEEGIPLTHDTKEPMYVAGLDHKGNVVYYMRQSRLMSPENRQRTEDMRQKTVKYHPERGMVESMSPDALINLRGQGRMAEAESRLRNRGDERFAEGGQVGMDAIKKERYYNGGAIRHYADAGFVEPMTEEEEQLYRAPAALPLTAPSAEPAHDLNKAFDVAVQKESRNRQFDPKTGQPLTSSQGAIGAAQVMPTTAPEAAGLAGVPFDEQKYKTDADYNKAIGKAYFDKQYRDFGGELDKTYAAYNAGPGATRKAIARAQKEGGNYLDYLGPETQDYVATNMANYSGQQQAEPKQQQAKPEQQWEQLPDDTQALAQRDEAQKQSRQTAADQEYRKRIAYVYNQQLQRTFMAGDEYGVMEKLREQDFFGPNGEPPKNIDPELYTRSKEIFKATYADEIQKKQKEAERIQELNKIRAQAGAPLLAVPATPRAPLAGTKIAESRMAQDLMGGAGPTETPTTSKQTDSMDLLGPQGQYAKGLAEKIAGERQRTEAMQGPLVEQQKMLQKNVEDKQALYNKTLKMQTDLQNYHTKITNMLLNKDIDPMKAWNDRSTLSKVSTAVGMLIGGMGGGLMKQENPAYKFLQKQIDDSIDAQKSNVNRLDNLLKTNTVMLQNGTAASDTLRAQLGELVVKQMEAEAKKYEGTRLEAEMRKNIGDYYMQLVTTPLQKAAFAKIAYDPSTTETQLDQMMPTVQALFPELYEDIARRRVPGYGVATRRPLTLDEQTQIKSANTFIANANKLERLVNDYKYRIALNPISNEEKARAISIMAGLVADLAKAHGKEPGEGVMGWLESQLGSPTSIKDAIWTGQKKLEATVEEMKGRKQANLLQAFNSDVVESLMRKDEIQMPQYAPTNTESKEAFKRQIRTP